MRRSRRRGGPRPPHGPAAPTGMYRCRRRRPLWAKSVKGSCRSSACCGPRGPRAPAPATAPAAPSPRSPSTRRPRARASGRPPSAAPPRRLSGAPGGRARRGRSGRGWRPGRGPLARSPARQPPTWSGLPRRICRRHRTAGTPAAAPGGASQEADPRRRRCQRSRRRCRCRLPPPPGARPPSIQPAPDPKCTEGAQTRARACGWRAPRPAAGRRGSARPGGRFGAAC
mmetsp:Transcript_13968/g.49152  ORF Transcript_13968/g.49152 Transcript_13968/m.49152 type:complete len:227 (-) Transcript_13968:334-1014(-)